MKTKVFSPVGFENWSVRDSITEEAAAITMALLPFLMVTDSLTAPKNTFREIARLTEYPKISQNLFPQQKLIVDHFSVAVEGPRFWSSSHSCGGLRFLNGIL